MILAFDTYYFNNKAKTVCIAFNNWNESENFDTFSETIDNIEDYRPGEFYKRELPCILSLLKSIDTKKAEYIIIDGYVFLDDNDKPGLGGHLYNSLNRKKPVIGVAKTNFATIDRNKRELLRGKSIKPLYITATGMDMDDAVKYISSMSGENRIPTLLKTLDRLTKEVTV
ncbi:MAG: endonuclease V [Ferruginibacter sp.]